ncbi:SDR family NAD(P)-dependent oxidoreductase [Spirillospora sp. NPDC048819]|uniref:SDR family NAD(P)-dependent oxidoreductase n=1 Tax=Spirillospora sp. NPDC048819 TaxID=3155268 RepID=UPI0033C25718
MAADTAEYGRGPGDRLRTEIIGVTPFGRPAPQLAVAVARAGGTGVLDLGADRASGLAALADVRRWWTGPFGVRVPAGCRVRPAEIPAAADTVLVDAPALRSDASLDVAGFARGRRLLVEVVGPDEAAAVIPVARGFTGDVGLIARGCEAGGRAGDLTAFVLLQRLAADPSVDVPVYAAGGIGPHTAAAAVAGGAAGVVLDVQLALVRETDLPAGAVTALSAMDGGETGTVQDGPLAAALAGRHKTAGGVVQAIRREIGAHLRAAVRAEPLAPRRAASGGAPPAVQAYPVVQGPMTQVSDCSAFAGAVAQEGGLPFLALAAMDGDRVQALLRETADRLGGRPWGVGVAGFAPPDVRAAQLAAVRAAGPPYALIAGGSPAEAEPLEAAGVSTYLDVPSPEQLDRFLDEGARKFLFEGRESGGHVGPRASFPLWEAQIGRLMECDADAGELSVMFAGGVHDERSAAMVAALAGPLAERGADVRVVMGTAYLFTSEAVATGAILPGYQETALACDGTALLESSPEHVTRCARTPYVETFAETRRELEQVGTPRRDVWRRLEKLNLARLRVAAKGLRRATPVDVAEQRASGLYTLGQVAALRSATTGIAALHEQVTAGATAFLAARAAEVGVTAARPARTDAARPADIAIIGIGCVFPGARDADGYWANIVAGVDSVTAVTRWDPEIHYDPSAEGKSPSKWGGFIPDIPFDAHAHGIPPHALGAIEPIQLLSLEVASRALRDAGYADRPFDRAATSVFFGAGGGGDLGTAYAVRATLPSYFGEVPAALDERLPRPTEESLPGVLTNVIAARVAGALGLRGGGYTVDAAGAASLAALDAACKDLAAGASDMVLCGGADLGGGVRDYLLLASARALSPSGRCAAFDASADGIAPGEGVACVVLKRLADAERDGDRIYAVVKSVAGAGDGRAPGGGADLTTSRAEGRRLALERAHERAGVPPAGIGLIETDGTGVQAGDRAELTALASAFTGAAAGGVTLGSVKSQIGHTGCAAGLAGLIKTALALHTGVLPGTLHLSRPGPEWEPGGPLVFGGAARPWAARPGDRHAGLSGSGAGGVCFHAVLSGYGGAPEPVSGLAEWPAELFLVRAPDRPAARAEIDRLLDLSAGEPRLRDLARTAASLEGPVQAAFVATGLDDLRHKLTLAAESGPAPDVFHPSGEPGQVAFVFPGQGSQRPTMLADLFVAFPRLQRLLRLAGGRYASAMFPPAAFTPDETGRHQAEITRVAQPALGIAGLAVHRLLTAVGVHPDLAAGHGHGELVALCAAGVVDDTDMVELSAARAEAILAAAGGDPGAMATVAASLREVRETLAGVSEVVVANHNAPREVVISGTRAGLDRALAALSAAGLDAERIPVPCAFHSPLVAAASADLRTDLLGRDLRSPAFPVWANATAAPYDTDPAELAATLAGQIAAPVRFVEQIEAMYGAGARTFVEAGPGDVLTGLIGKILGDRPHTAVSCDAPGENGLAHFLRTLAGLAAAGVPVDPLPLFAGRDARPLTAAPAAAPGWFVNGHLVRTADGGYPANALRPAERVPEGSDRDAEAAVLEYLRAGRELIAAQREVVLRHLGATPPATSPAPVPAPRPVLPGETVSVPHQARSGSHVRTMALSGPGVPAPSTEGDSLVSPRAEGPAAAPAETSARPGVVRHVLRVVELDALPVPPESGTVFTGRRFIVVDDGCGVALELAGMLARHGAQVRTPREVDGACDGLIHLAALRPGAAGVLPQAYAGIRRALAGGLRWLVVGSGAGGRFGRRFDGGGIGDPAPGAGLRGLARTVAQEYPEVLVRALDVDTEDTPRAIAQRIMAELLDAEAPVVVGHEGDLRHGLSVVPAEPPGEPPVTGAPPPGPDGVVLLTGGARGVTAQVALELARTSGCHIEVMGRTPEPVDGPAFADVPDEAGLRRALVASGEGETGEIEATVRRILAERETHRNLEALREHAASVRYHSGDVRNAHAVRDVVTGAYRRHGRLDGVVHGAGLVENRLVRDMTPESFEHLYRTKVDGACALAQAVEPDIGFFVVLGGIAGVHGVRGQVAHAAASDACDTLAHVWRTRLRGRVLVADWGPWARSEPERESECERGAVPVEPEAGAAALLREIVHGNETQVVFTGAALTGGVR